MIIKINSRSEIPIYLQLRNQIVKGIGKGELEQGRRILPTDASDGGGPGSECHDSEQSLSAGLKAEWI